MKLHCRKEFQRGQFSFLHKTVATWRLRIRKHNHHDGQQWASVSITVIVCHQIALLMTWHISHLNRCCMAV